jgi:hypothetical protein
LIKKRPEEYSDKELNELIKKNEKVLEENKKIVNPGMTIIHQNQEIETNLKPLYIERARRKQLKASETH